MSEHYKTFMRQLLELYLILETEGECAKADNVREASEPHWYAMTEQEQARARAWSSLFQKFDDYRAGKAIRRPAKFVREDKWSQATSSTCCASSPETCPNTSTSPNTPTGMTLDCSPQTTSDGSTMDASQPSTASNDESDREAK